MRSYRRVSNQLVFLKAPTKLNLPANTRSCLVLVPVAVSSLSIDFGYAQTRPVSHVTQPFAPIRTFTSDSPTSVHRSDLINQRTAPATGARHQTRRQEISSSHSQLRGSALYTLYLVPLIASALVVYHLVAGQAPDVLTANSTDQTLDREILNGDEMEALPGRPGNLTPEQEEKLRKFWEMFLQICGVFDDDTADGEAPASLADQGKSATAGSEKSKRKRLNIFKKRKDKGKEGKENKGAEKGKGEPAVPTIKENDTEDKWGESKAYHENLAKHPPEEIRATIWSMVKHDNPDALMLRFLRARKWDLQRALVMLVSTMNWRASEMNVDSELMINGEEYALLNEKSSDESVKKQGEDFLAQMRLGKSYCYGVDKAGRPICVCRARLHKAGEQSEESLERYTVYLIETTRFLISPPIDTGVSLLPRGATSCS